MKKLIIMLLALSLLLAGCGSNDTPETQPPQTIAPTQAPAPAQTQTPEQAPEAQQTVVNNRDYSFALNGVTLTPGAAFDAAALPSANSLYQIPSCAFEGTDNVYAYDSCEIIAYQEGTTEVIYSIYLLDAEAATPEGLCLGADESMIQAAYGPHYNLADGQYTYLGVNTQLIILTSDGFVVSIEYRILPEE